MLVFSVRSTRNVLIFRYLMIKVIAITEQRINASPLKEPRYQDD